ncbi:armadillo-like helical domain-containing protein 2 [Acropora millepora]|uniref:armadillo-like helical domain-containing protein 2 n=1 Tax=Acropora millepora TaxID=45264 RepID=UPI001CF2185C|nr:armadillo-like helical domain-containing protein 2 [Acropora millepora]
MTFKTENRKLKTKERQTVSARVLIKLARKSTCNSQATQLEDVGALVDDNLFERDILIATKKLSCLSNVLDRTQAVRDLGHLSWSGGPVAAKFAGNQLINLCGLLNDPNEPPLLKMYTVQAISEICCANKENQDKARLYGILHHLCELLETTEPELSTLRRSSAACLLTLCCENVENQRFLLGTKNLQENLSSVANENWSAWQENEAAELITFLGLRRSANSYFPRSKMLLGTNLEGEHSSLTEI